MSDRPVDENEALGATLRRLRAAREATLADVADAAGMSIALLSRIERGERRPSPQALAALADYFDVPEEELTGRAIAERFQREYPERYRDAAVRHMSRGPMDTVASMPSPAAPIDDLFRDSGRVESSYSSMPPGHASSFELVQREQEAAEQLHLAELAVRSALRALRADLASEDPALRARARAAIEELAAPLRRALEDAGE